jgi:hypothetical protein
MRKVIVAVETVNSTGSGADVTPVAVNDPQHFRDLVGALDTLKRGAANSHSWRRKLRFLLFIVGPGLLAMGVGNDAGGVQAYARMGQNYGMKLLRALILLFPILLFCREILVRLGSIFGIWQVFALPLGGGWYAQSGERNP